MRRGAAFDLSPVLLFAALIVLLLGLPGACSRSDEAGDAVEAEVEMTPTLIPTMEIVTPTPGASQPAAPQPQVGNTGSADQDTGDETDETPPGAYVVQAGDTLFAIATRFGIEMETLAEANGISDPSALQVGQVLVIPASDQ
jgi:nucleoid-associated protein YgaU